MSMPIQYRTTPPGPEDIQAQYGFVTLIAQQIPEIGALMQQAVNGNWTADRFSMALAATNWWKTTPDGSRQWLVKNIADPASANVELTAGIGSTRNTMIQLGIPTDVGNDRLGQLWLQAKLQGLDDVTTRGFLFREMVGDKEPGDPSALGGRYGQLINGMVESAVNYGYALTPQAHSEIYRTARDIMIGGGTAEPEVWKSKLMSYAASKYAPFADRIRGGETVMDIARPYVESYANILEVNPKDVALDDSAVQKALQGDGAQGQTVWQFEQGLRKDPRWGKTVNAKDAAAKTLTSIGRAFGMIG